MLFSSFVVMIYQTVCMNNLDGICGIFVQFYVVKLVSQVYHDMFLMTIKSLPVKFSCKAINHMQ